MPANPAPGSAGYQGTTDWYRQVAREIQAFFTSITTAILNVGSGSLRTTNLGLSQSTDGGYTTLDLQPLSGNTPVEFALVPSGTQTATLFMQWGSSTKAATTYSQQEYFNTGWAHTITSANLSAGAELIITGNAGTWVWNYSQTGALTLPGDVVLPTATGTKIGTATNQLLGFYNKTPVDQPATVADPAGGAVIDAESRTAIIAIIDRLQELGLIA